MGLIGPAGRWTVSIDRFRLVLNDTADAQLFVDHSYNPYLGPRPGMRPTDLDAFYDRRAAIDAPATGTFDSLFVATNRFRVARDGRTFPARGVNRGRLTYGRAAESSLADWFVDPSGLVEVRLPWGLLNVTDPSSRTVLRRVRDPGPFLTEVSPGFAFVVTDPHGGRVANARPYSWRVWETPVWHERLKPAYYAMQTLWGSW